MSVAYLINPSIGEDQIWAARRFLPAVIPLWIILTYYALSQFYSLKIRWTLCLLLAMVTVGLTIRNSSVILVTREDFPRFSQIVSMCKELPENSVVFWVDILSLEMVQTARSYCGVESFGITQYDPLTLSEIAHRASSQGLTAILAVTDFEEGKVGNDAKFTVMPIITTKKLERTVGRIPINTYEFVREIRVGEIGSNGEVTPL